MWENCNVVILSTNEKSGTIWMNTLGQLIHTHVSGEYKEKYTPYNLYIISDEEIKEGEWCFEMHNGPSNAPKDTPRFTDENGNIWWLRQMNMNCSANDPQAKKIIATTDTLITVYRFNDPSDKLPQPSQQFIEKYIKEYNKSNIITKVEVEEECIGYYPGYIGDIDVYGIKVNPDNTINIKPIKDSWSREEVIKLCKNFANYVNNFDGFYRTSDLNKWIEENL